MAVFYSIIRMWHYVLKRLNHSHAIYWLPVLWQLITRAPGVNKTGRALALGAYGIAGVKIWPRLWWSCVGVIGWLRRGKPQWDWGLGGKSGSVPRMLMFQARPEGEATARWISEGCGQRKDPPGKREPTAWGRGEGGMFEEQKDILQSCDTECDGRTVKAGDIVGASSGGPLNTMITWLGVTWE